MSPRGQLEGERFVLGADDGAYPPSLRNIATPPKKLYGIGSASALKPGLAIVGARKATPYGISCALRFARIAGQKGVTVISGGARGCDSAAHSGALDSGIPTVAFLGGGCDRIYPPEHYGLFQRIIDGGGAVVSERPWDFAPMPFAFRERNRLIAGLSEAVLIVEAGLPSGTFSTADAALDSGKEVLVVPGSIASRFSAGSNRLLLQGAAPIVDDESFEDALFRIFGSLRWAASAREGGARREGAIVESALAKPMSMEELLQVSGGDREKMMSELVDAEARGVIARYPDGTWGPA